ncbi:MAG: queuosine precursor transporter [Planctomycetota bacterium]|nr:queuosine precursor transporter [Planctomycetota bacterium]
MNNEIIAIMTFLILGILTLACTRLGIKYLFILSTSIIIISNVTVQMNVEVWGIGISWAVIIYSMVYLITDILSECYERSLAYKLAASNLAVQIFLWVYVWSSLQVVPKAESVEIYETMQNLFGSTARITFAAIVASAGTFLDIWVYEFIKKKSTGKIMSKLWIRNNISTVIGQSANTALFFTLALYGVVPNPALVSIVVSAVVIKVVIAACDTPFIYLARRIIANQNG